MIPGSANPLLLKPAGSTTYSISRSLRFNSSDSAYLSRTPGSAGNRKTWTWAAWVKRSAFTGAEQYIFSYTLSSPNNQTYIRFDSSGEKLRAAQISSGSAAWNVEPAASFRDPSAWFHLCLAVDTTQATASNRVRIYVNGTELTAFTTASYPTQNLDTDVNSTVEHRLGTPTVFSSLGFSGYLADVHLIDGQQLTPSAFGEFDATTGVWVPKRFTGSYGTNGAQLKFEDNSSNTATTLGKDTSGNGNNWTPNNLQVSAGTVYSNGTVTGTAVNPWSNLFDGNLSTTPTSQSPGSTQLTLAQSISFTQLRVYANKNPSENLYVNGTALTGIPVNTGASWVDITSQVSSPLTSIKVESLSSGQYSYIYAIEVNGSQLINGGAANIDSLVDVPTSSGTDSGLGGEVRGNYATFNPIFIPSDANRSFSNGNLDVSLGASNAWRAAVGTIAYPTSGKWYHEVTIGTFSTNGIFAVGIGRLTESYSGNYPIGEVNSAQWVYMSDGKKMNASTYSPANYGASYTTGDVVGIAYDADNGTLTFYKNGSTQGTAYTGLTGVFIACFGGAQVNAQMSVNFGQRPFAYTAPSGFKALCTANLPAPLVTKSSTVFDTVLYTGNGSTQNITGLGFSPDLVWIKERATAYWHVLTDSVRGAGKTIYTNSTDKEDTRTTSIASLNSDGFSLNNDSEGSGVNRSGQACVAFCWDAGSTTVTNTQGSITSSVRANATAGFSIVTYTGNSTAGATVGHGLGIAPGMIIVKNRTATAGYLNWGVYHASLGGTKALYLNTTGAESSDANEWNNTAPSSTVFSLGFSSGNGHNISGQTYVAYCFAPQVGYSSFGSYTGNGSADGPFVFCNFRPRWVMFKRTDSTGNWVVLNTASSSYNVADKYLMPNSSQAEDTAAILDILSSGFKLRYDNVTGNANGGTYIYAAFAESPFQYARAR